MDTNLILACAVMPANRPEVAGIPLLRDDLAMPSHEVGELFIDRGYIASVDVRAMADAGRSVVCKPWAQPNGSRFPKSAFLIDIRSKVITCPNGKKRTFELGTTVSFAAADCRQCSKRSACNGNVVDRGRQVRIADDEPLRHELREQISSPAGREHLRERVVVDHRLAHFARKQGTHAGALATSRRGRVAKSPLRRFLHQPDVPSTTTQCVRFGGLVPVARIVATFAYLRMARFKRHG